ncbi:hypothetical protein IWQ60_009101 [Tieghemiomyces parasiticus]|uniref:Cytochrome b5 heme-binding domain-containing protein n=1 Tax=Tieghemiomyces parasiticus TaxID=78921 RepID=A0A9W7ZVZ0_9FUNG|nr:hypothetical protein IWQ60_009101 [Tieghemiomyces parasiticus]
MSVIPHSEFLRRIQGGEALFIFDGRVYKVDKFMHQHPGGRLAIWHMIGRDATSEIRVMHPDSVITHKMPRYCQGEYLPEDMASETACESDEGVQGLNNSPLKPPVSTVGPGFIPPESNHAYNQCLPSHDSLPEVQDLTTRTVNRSVARAAREVEYETLPVDYEAVEKDFQVLQAEILARGLHQTRYSCYGREAIRYFLFLAGMLGLSLYGPVHWLNYTLSAVCTGLLWQQLALCVHDLGHNGVTHDLFWDGLIGVILADFVGGLSVGWWKKNHNVHHIVTNDAEHDPDIQHLPFFAVTTKLFRNLRSSYYGRVLRFDAVAALLIPVQHLLYIPILCFGRFNLYFLSVSHLLTADFAPWRWLELTGIACFWAWYGTFLTAFPTWQWALFHFVLSHMVTVILHLQITLSHFGMSTTCPDPDRECFAARQLRTTMDIDCPEWFDWFHGGLQYQVEHHLFPRLPRHNLRAVQPLVKDFAARHPGLKFYSFGFTHALELVLDSMKSVGEQVQDWLQTRAKLM